MADISREARKALHQMGKNVHAKHGMGDYRSVFAECPCTKCVDGGIDMPHCSECNRGNGFRYFRKKVR